MSTKKVLVDTDIGPDCDDVAALAMMNIYANRGMCEILGIGHCTSNPYGAGTIDTINLYYGHENIPIGTYYGANFLTDEACMKYNRHLTQTMPNRYKDSQPEPAVKMYRRILAEQEEHSVEFVAIGPLNNLSDLLNSAPDEVSPLSGVQLVGKKVIRLVSMAGVFPCADMKQREKNKQITGKSIYEHEEYNVMCDVAAAQNVVDKWPTPRVFLGFEAGLVETCGILQKTAPQDHPVRVAYQLYTENGYRFSWDLLTMEYAIDVNCGHYKTSALGRVMFDNMGRTQWLEDVDGVDRFVEWAAPEEKIASDINSLLQNG